MKGYKLTEKDGTTYHGCQWAEDVTHTALRGKLESCTSTAIHYYANPWLAELCNPIHARFNDPILWEGVAEGKTKTDGLKRFCKKFTTIKQIPMPVLTSEQKVKIAILLTLQIYKEVIYRETNYVRWAHRWLSGKDRTFQSAYNNANTTPAMPHLMIQEMSASQLAQSATSFTAMSAARAAENDTTDVSASITLALLFVGAYAELVAPQISIMKVVKAVAKEKKV